MRVQETMRRVRSGGYTVRLWVDGWNAADADMCARYVELALKGMAGRRTSDIADTLSTLPLVSAVEVVRDETGDGHLVYPDWP